ncbi:ferredoxin [Microbispora triticiradicis]|uniref:ferredoxin n=1 Tax=Microbispora triticiradicis TaxID=2200763 RepID=UPI001AD6207E|nr:ferredoxin [Microbispora triticiradicis]MBO4270853.1 ferredoxin [Microbispora triticiradicis]
MWVSADRERCISGGRCMAATSEVFDQDEDGIVVVLTSNPAPEQEDRVRRAAYLCPSRAIRIGDGPSGG